MVEKFIIDFVENIILKLLQSAAVSDTAGAGAPAFKPGAVQLLMFRPFFMFLSLLPIKPHRSIRIFK